MRARAIVITAATTAVILVMILAASGILTSSIPDQDAANQFQGTKGAPSSQSTVENDRRQLPPNARPDQPSGARDATSGAGAGSVGNNPAASSSGQGPSSSSGPGAAQ